MSALELDEPLVDGGQMLHASDASPWSQYPLRGTIRPPTYGTDSYMMPVWQSAL